MGHESWVSSEKSKSVIFLPNGFLCGRSLPFLCLLSIACLLPLRQVQAADTRVILFIVDSVSASLMYEMIDSGELPNLGRALHENGVRVEEAVAPFPTISFYAHACILTGCWADRHGVTGIRWYDHRTGKSRSYAGIGSELIDRDMNPEVKTVFEHLEGLQTAAIGSVVHRGADEQQAAVEAGNRGGRK